MPSPQGIARYIVCLVAGLLLSGTSSHAQMRKDPDTITDQEFLRLLQQSDQLNKEQKQRARRTKNPRVLVPLAGDEDPGVRFYVAFNPYTPASSLGNLAKDPNPTVRWGVARNSRFLFDIDTTFVKDLDEGGGCTRRIGACVRAKGHFSDQQHRNRDRPTRGVLEGFADLFQEYEVRKKRQGLMVYNGQTSNLVLETMAEDYSEVVPRRVIQQSQRALWNPQGFFTTMCHRPFDGTLPKTRTPIQPPSRSYPQTRNVPCVLPLRGIRLPLCTFWPIFR